MVNGVSTPEAESLELMSVANVDLKFKEAVKNNDSEALQEVLIDPSFNSSQEILNKALRYASGHGYVGIVRLLCEGDEKKAEINSTDEKGRSAAFIAARMGQKECLGALIQLGAEVNLATKNDKKGASKDSSVGQFCRQIRSSEDNLNGSFDFQVPFDERDGLTPLHAAVRCNSPDCVRLILEHNGDVHAEDGIRQQPIMHAGAWLKARDKVEVINYEKILGLLLEYGADAKAKYSDESDDIPVSMSALRTAAGLGSAVAVKALLDRGANPKWGYDCGSCRTALHDAAKGGHQEVLKLLLQNTEKNGEQESRQGSNQQLLPENRAERGRRKEEDIPYTKWINCKDNAGNTPLHFAAFSGSKPCISLLLEKGGNLGAENKAKMRAMEAILVHLPDGKEFIRNILDSMVMCSSIPEEPKELEVHLNFKILAPKGNRRRAEVVYSLFTARYVDADDFLSILDHPLVKAYINLEFSRTKLILGLLFLIYSLQVLTLTFFVSFQMSGNEPLDLACQIIHSLADILVMMHVLYRLVINPRYYLYRFEIFSNGLGTLLSFFGMIMLWKNADDSLTTNFISLACLLQWIGFMSLCGLLPFLGTRALVFSDLFRNLWWTTASLIFVIIGYSLFLYHQLHSTHDPFKDFFSSFESTIIMLIQDHQHGEIYSQDKLPSTFFRGMFIIFMFIGPLLVLNLILSLSLSDKNLMISRGKIRRLCRMTEFLDFVDKARLLSSLKTGEEVSLNFILYPYETQKLSPRNEFLASFLPTCLSSLGRKIPKKLECELISLSLKKINDLDNST